MSRRRPDRWTEGQTGSEPARRTNRGFVNMSAEEDLDRLYQQRFPEAALAQKDAIWKVLCGDFFQRFVNAGDTVVDIGAGYCEFINNTQAARKIAVDLNPDIRRFAAPDVQVVNAPCTAIGQIESASVDGVFMSNFLEHLPSKERGRGSV